MNKSELDEATTTLLMMLAAGSDDASAVKLVGDFNDLQQDIKSGDEGLG